MKTKALSLLLALTLLMGIIAIPAAGTEVVEAILPEIALEGEARADDASSGDLITYNPTFTFDYPNDKVKIAPGIPSGHKLYLTVGGDSTAEKEIKGNTKLSELYDYFASLNASAPSFPVTIPAAKAVTITIKRTNHANKEISGSIVPRFKAPADIKYDVAAEEVVASGSDMLGDGYQASFSKTAKENAWIDYDEEISDTGIVVAPPASGNAKDLFVRFAPTDKNPAGEVQTIASIKARAAAPKAAALKGIVKYHGNAADTVVFNPASGSDLTMQLQYRIKKPAKLAQQITDPNAYVWRDMDSQNLMGTDYGSGAVGYDGTKAVALEIRTKASGDVPASKPVNFTIPRQGGAPGVKLTPTTYTLSNITGKNVDVQYYIAPVDTLATAIPLEDARWTDIVPTGTTFDFEPIFDALGVSSKTAGVDVWVRFASREVITVNKDGVETSRVSAFRSSAKKFGKLTARGVAPDAFTWDAATGKIEVPNPSASSTKKVYMGTKYEYSLNNQIFKKAVNNESFNWLKDENGEQVVYVRWAVSGKNPSSETAKLTISGTTITDVEAVS